MTTTHDTHDTLLDFLRALEDGGKLDRYNRPYLDRLLTEHHLSLNDVKQRPPLISRAYDVTYKKTLLQLLEYEFSQISQANILTVAEKHAFDVHKTREELRNGEVERMRKPASRYTVLPSCPTHPELKAYYQELDRKDRNEYEKFFSSVPPKSAPPPKAKFDGLEPYRLLLGVDRQATKEQIIAAYRAKALKCHPDKNGDEDLFKAIAEARDKLLASI